MPRSAAPNTVAALAATITLAGCAFKLPPADPPSSPAPTTTRPVFSDRFSSQGVRYRCQGGTELDVIYLNLTDGTSFAALHFEGRTALLQNRPTASGARYVALDEQHSLRWHTKGSEGHLAFLAADHTARERTLLSDCRAQPAP